MTKIILRTLVVGIGVIVLGHLLLGCDGGDGSATREPGQAGDAGGAEAPAVTGGKCSSTT